MGPYQSSSVGFGAGRRRDALLKDASGQSIGSTMHVRHLPLACSTASLHLPARRLRLAHQVLLLLLLAPAACRGRQEQAGLARGVNAAQHLAAICSGTARSGMHAGRAQHG